MSSFFSSLFNERKAELNEDINKMIIYITKNYTPADRVKLIQGVKDGIKNDLEREAETAEERKTSAENALQQLKTV